MIISSQPGLQDLFHIHNKDLYAVVNKLNVFSEILYQIIKT